MSILVLVPFHALFTTWLGVEFGYIDVFRIWKEILITMVAVLAAVVLVRRQHTRAFFRDRIIYLILAYALLHVLLGGWAFARGQVSAEALLFALVVNLRLFAFFALAWFVGLLVPRLRALRYKLLLVPAVIVIGFGLLQLLVLPHDFLTHFGYGPDTITAVYTVDNKLEYQRLQSTLRGPNPLGAYLMVILAAVTALWLARDTYLSKAKLSLTAVTGAIVLIFTYSRSAWLGTIAALALLVFWSLKNAQAKRALLAGGVVLLVFAAGVVWLMRDNDVLQNALFHTDEHSSSAASSNAERAENVSRGVREVVAEPLGRGPGTAGPASFRNTAQPARLAENYFLQLGQEVGVVGLGLFVAISILVAQRLWQLRHDTIARMLVASLAGITLVNILSHAWTDDTLAMLWWGLAGITLATLKTKTQGDILKAKRQHTKT